MGPLWRWHMRPGIEPLLCFWVSGFAGTGLRVRVQGSGFEFRVQGRKISSMRPLLGTRENPRRFLEQCAMQGDAFGPDVYTQDSSADGIGFDSSRCLHALEKRL